jgi:DNA-binding transcriptional LysR family regulator
LRGRSGSFTAAAVQLDTTTANVSRAVSNLEAHLQTRLLNRTTRRIALTEAGKRYLLRCEQILAYVEEAEAEASDAHARPAGQLKVHTMTGIGQHFVIDAIARYRKTHPDVTFDLTMANRVPDLLDEGYDVSIVLASELPDSGFVSQRLGITYSIVCASPAYVKANGCAQKPSDLLNHACLRLVSPVIPWKNGPSTARTARKWSPSTARRSGELRRRHEKRDHQRHGRRRAAAVRSDRRPAQRHPGTRDAQIPLPGTEPVRHLPVAAIPGCKDQDLGRVFARIAAGIVGGTSSGTGGL